MRLSAILHSSYWQQGGTICTGRAALYVLAVRAALYVLVAGRHYMYWHSGRHYMYWQQGGTICTYADQAPCSELFWEPTCTPTLSSSSDSDDTIWSRSSDWTRMRVRSWSISFPWFSASVDRAARNSIILASLAWQQGRHNLSETKSGWIKS